MQLYRKSMKQTYFRMELSVKRIFPLALLMALSIFALRAKGRDASIDKFPEEKMVYPLVRGISCDNGLENDVWIGGRKLDVFMRFDTPQEARDFHALRYEVGGTPNALNQEGKHKVAPCLYVVGTLSPAEDVEKERQERKNRRTHPAARYMAERENKSPILHIKYWFITTPFLMSKDTLVDWIPLRVNVHDHLTDETTGMKFCPKSRGKRKKLTSESGERHELRITDNKENSHLQEGLFPVIGMDLIEHRVTLLLAGSDTVPLQCAVQFKNGQQSEDFFSAINRKKIEESRQVGLPPVFYLIGRYDMEQKMFIASRWFEESQIRSEIILLREADDTYSSTEYP